MKRFAIKTDDGVEVYLLMWGGSQDGQGWSGGVLRLPGSTQRDVTGQEKEETFCPQRAGRKSEDHLVLFILSCFTLFDLHSILFCSILAIQRVLLVKIRTQARRAVLS